MPQPRPATVRRAFTLVELLVVITIIGMLIALLLPAVQGARESARRAQCLNNLKQIGIGALNHLDALKQFPTGGWGPHWTGDPDRGTGLNQPGGWIYNILPYVEQTSLHQLPRDNQPDVVTQAQLDGALQMSETPVAMFNCPTRRRAIAYPYILPTHWDQDNGVKKATCTVHAVTDYGANAGDYNVHERSYPRGYTNVATFPWGSTDHFHGVVFHRSTLSDAHVTDGMSNTYFACEKYLDPDVYVTGWGGADNHPMYQGYDRDTAIAGGPTYPPMADTPGVEEVFRCGSAHPSGFQGVLCDGSAHIYSFSIDLQLHGRLANRKDGKPTVGAN